jgi:hypothetical protein
LDNLGEVMLKMFERSKKIKSVRPPVLVHTCEKCPDTAPRMKMVANVNAMQRPKRRSPSAPASAATMNEIRGTEPKSTKAPNVTAPFAHGDESPSSGACNPSSKTI